VSAALVCATAAALAGGGAWAVKSAAILATGDQPPVVFEVAPPAFAVALGCAALELQPAGTRRTAVLTLAAVSVATAATALVSDLLGELLGAALAVSSLALVVGLLLLDRRLPPLRPGWVVGAATLPAALVGGLLAVVDERLLEVPLLALSLGWVWWGLRLLATVRGTPRPQLPDAEKCW
jgi:hypothetical protein